MNPYDDPDINPAVQDLARALAHDHIIGMLTFMFVCSQAERQEIPASTLAKSIRDGVLGAWQDGNRKMPPEFMELVRDHTAKVLDHAVEMCAVHDSLRASKIY